MTRAPYAVGPSACLTLPGYSAIDTFPIRSPLVVADWLMPRVAGKQLCEIGTRNGDLTACLAHFAANVTAFEMDESYCARLRRRGIRSVCKRVERVLLLALLAGVASGGRVLFGVLRRVVW